MDIVIDKIGGIWDDDWIQPMTEEKYQSFDIYFINFKHFYHLVDMLKSINSDPRLNKRKPNKKKTDNDLKDGMMEEEEEETKDDMDNDLKGNKLQDDMMEEEEEEEELKDETKIENDTDKDEEDEKQDKNDDSSNEKISPIKESKQISKKKDGKGKKKKEKKKKENKKKEEEEEEEEDKKNRKRRTNRRVGKKKRPKYKKKIGKNQGEEPTGKQREGYTISAIGFLRRMLQRPTNLNCNNGVDLTWVIKKSLDIGFYPFISNAIDVKYLCLNPTSLW